MRYDVSEHIDLKVNEEKDLIDILKKRCLSMPPSPTSDTRPILPTDLHEHPPVEHGRLLRELTTYFNFASGRHAVAKILANNLKEAYDHAYSNAYAESKGSVEDRKHKAKLNRQVKELREKWLDTKNEADIIESAVLEPLKRDIATVSRLISLQEAELNMSGRSHNVDNRTMNRELKRLK
jgi:hypothetical protein